MVLYDPPNDTLMTIIFQIFPSHRMGYGFVVFSTAHTHTYIYIYMNTYMRDVRMQNTYAGTLRGHGQRGGTHTRVSMYVCVVHTVVVVPDAFASISFINCYVLVLFLF